MGDSSVNVGGMGGSAHWPEQVPADDAGLFDAAAAGSSADESMSMPLRSPAAPMGNSGNAETNTPKESPTHFTVKYQNGGGYTLTATTPFVPGASLMQYLKRTRLDYLLRGLITAVGGKRVRPTYVPTQGEVLMLVPTRFPGLQLR